MGHKARTVEHNPRTIGYLSNIYPCEGCRSREISVMRLYEVEVSLTLGGSLSYLVNVCVNCHPEVGW